jgi:hypothetical protein
MRGPSAAVFRPNKNFVFERFPTNLGPVNIAYTSRWVKRSETVTIPGHLWVEIRGFAPDLETAIGPFANAGLAGISVIATSTNAAVTEPEVELAFESTVGSKEREYFQSYLPTESSLLHPAREVDLQATLALLNALKRHPEFDRLLRAINQYNLALQNWKLGHATMALAHLWMACEALTKVALRTECTARGLSDPNDLAAALKVDIKQLDATIRRDFILHGDAECYKQAKEASDGLEHGYLGFDRVWELSKQVRHRMAHHVRTSIFDLSGLTGDPKAKLLSDTFAKPLGPSRVVKYLRGRLLGDRDDLARPDSEYPFIRWATTLKKAELDEGGTLQIQLEEKLTPELGEGISFSPKSMEVWQPD